MREAWNDLTAFFRIGAQGGAYLGLGLLSAAYLTIKGKQGKTGKKAVIYIALWFLILFNPIAVCLYRRLTGREYPFYPLILAVPVLPLIAWAGAEVIRENGKDRGKKMILSAGLSLAVMAAGTVTPWTGGGNLELVSETDYGKESEMIRMIMECAEDIEEQNTEPVLVAPKGIMNCIRRYDGSIRLVYGRNLWQTGAAARYHDRYSEEQVLLCQRMESGEVSVTETAELAIALGCNMIVCREPLTDTFTDYYGLYLYGEAQNLYLYMLH